jgi:heptosyltransferase-2
VIVAPNWLGDAIMALPAIADVRRAMSGGSLHVAARASVAPLFAMVPGIDDVVVLPPARGAAGEAAGRLRAGSFDMALLLPNSLNSAVTAWRAGVPERWGYRTDLRGALLTRAVTVPPRGGHTADYYQCLVRELGFPSGPLEPHLDVQAESRSAGLDLLRNGGWDGSSPVVAIAPGAAYGGSKRWPPESYAEVASALAGDGVRIVMIGSAADRDTGREVTAALGRGITIIDLMGRTDLLTLAGVLIHCRGLISNDSGAAHVGAALGISVTAMFGPFPENENRPIGRPAPAILTNEVWCRPCLLRECPLDHRCLRGISVDTVLAAARRST